MVLDGLINIMIIILILISFLEIMGLKNIRSSLYGFEALFHVLLSRFAEAESACSRGIAICPHLGYNYKLRAYSRIRLENPQGAVEDCTAELGLKENDAGVLALRAWANYQVGDFDLVVRDLEKAMKLEPGRRFYYVDCLRLIDAYQNLEQDKNVVAFCTSVIKPRMDRTLMEELLIRRALAFVKLSQTDKAINDCTSAIGIAHPECLNDLLELRGQLYESEGKSQLAENDRSMAQAIRSKEARMSEWVPAGAVKRLSAHCVDALVVGSIVCALLSTISILVSAGATESKFYFLLSTYTILSAMPYLFLVSVLDSLFVFPSLFALLFLLPASILYCVPEITTGSDYVSAVIQGISDPVIRIFVVVFIVIGSVNWLYRAALESSTRQATFGKRLARLRVTNIQGGAISFRQATRRHFLRILPGLPTAVALLVLCGCLTFELSLPLRLGASLMSVLLLYLSIGAYVRPGIHNSFSQAIVSDNYLYKPGTA